MVNRPAAPAANHSAAESDINKQKKANETQQAVVLFIIVLASGILSYFEEKFWDIPYYVIRFTAIRYLRES